jgi:hypothetical protein
VKTFWEPLFTIKKLLVFVSVIFKSKGNPVVSDAPADVMLNAVEPVVTPRPICLALIPPVPASEFAPDAPDKVWYMIELKVTLEDLNATVFTFEMLLPITSILV